MRVRSRSSIITSVGLVLVIAGHGIAADKMNGWSVDGQRSVFRKQGKTVQTIPLHYQDGKVGDTVIGDEAYTLAGCLILNRGIKHVEGTDMQSGPATIELFAADGKKYEPNKDDSRELFGTPYEHPSGRWGVILIQGGGAEGDISSFTLVRSNCSSESHSLERMLLYYGGDAKPDPNDPSLTIPGSFRDYKIIDSSPSGPNASLIIHPDGTSEIRPDKKAS